MSPARRPRWRAIRALVTDVDGVLTDGGLYYAENGDELKRFDVRDGQGLVSLREAGLLVAIVTRRQSTIVTRRARDLGIREVHQNVTDKAAVVRDLLARNAVAPQDAAYVGDDLGDLPAMELVGLPIAVKDAVSEVRRAALYITKASPGHGALREIADLVLAAQKPPKKKP
jgi:3-deoxy-D-manno-octulosonate 8-phosphate phosphatase (KDO 8-P phosphatase)